MARKITGTFEGRKAARERLRKPGFFETIFGLFLNPKETIMQLFDQQSPPYMISLLVLFIFVTYFPVFYVNFASGGGYMFSTGALIIVTITILSLIIYATIETIFLNILGVKASLTRIIAAIIYTLIPVVAVNLIFYGFGFIKAGNVSFFFTLTTQADQIYNLPGGTLYIIGKLIAHAVQVYVFVIGIATTSHSMAPTIIFGSIASFVPFIAILYGSYHVILNYIPEIIIYFEKVIAAGSAGF